MGQRHSRHALSWLKSQLHNPSLLCDRTPYTNLARFHVSIVAMRRTHVEGGNTRRLPRRGLPERRSTLTTRGWNSRIFVSSMLNGHTASKSALTMTSCLDRNGGCKSCLQLAGSTGRLAVQVSSARLKTFSGAGFSDLPGCQRLCSRTQGLCLVFILL